MTPQLRSWASAIVIALVLFLVAGVGLAWRLGMPAWGVVWLNDVLALVFLTPPLVLAGYVAAGETPLQAGGWLAYLEIYVPAIAALAGMAALAKWLGRTRLPGGAPLFLLPAVLQVLALTMVLDSYRDVTVAAVLSSAYLIAAMGTFLLPVIRPGWRAWLPMVAVALYLVILSTTGSGLAALGKIQAPMVVTQMVLLLVALSAVVTVPARGRASLAGRDIGTALIGPRESAVHRPTRAERGRRAQQRVPETANISPREQTPRHPLGSAISGQDIGSFPFE